MPDGPDSTVSGGLDCLTESVPDGYGKLITHPLGLEGDLNDARAPNSTVLEWYYQLAARWVPKLECSEYPQPTDDDQTDKKTPEHTVPESAPATASSADNAAATAQTPAAAGEASQAQQRKMKNKVPSAVYPRPKAMSFHNCAGPGDLNTKQSSFVFTYQVLIWSFSPPVLMLVILIFGLLFMICAVVHSLPRTWSQSSGTRAACTTAAACCA